MYLNRDQFISSMNKLAKDEASSTFAGQPGDESSVPGTQGEMQPMIEQPDQVKNDSRDPARGPEEALDQAAEALDQSSTRGYLKDALTNFDSAAKQTRKDLGAVLDNYGPQAASSSEVAKTSAAAFLDELTKIRALAG